MHRPAPPPGPLRQHAGAARTPRPPPPARGRNRGSCILHQDLSRMRKARKNFEVLQFLRSDAGNDPDAWSPRKKGQKRPFLTLRRGPGLFGPAWAFFGGRRRPAPTRLSILPRLTSPREPVWASSERFVLQRPGCRQCQAAGLPVGAVGACGGANCGGRKAPVEVRAQSAATPLRA